MKQRNKYFKPKANSNHQPPIFSSNQDSIPKPKKVEIMIPVQRDEEFLLDKESNNTTIESLTNTVDELTRLLHTVTVERDRLSKDLKDTSDALKYKELSIFALQASLEVQTDLINCYKDRIRELESQLDK